MKKNMPIKKPADIMQMIRDSVVDETFLLQGKFKKKYFENQKKKGKNLNGKEKTV